MKTRNDFVSNSSSCSFVIAIRSSFPFNDFVSCVCKNCLKHAEEGFDNEAFLAEQNELNNAVLNFHLRASELLYLGSLKVGDAQTVITKDYSFFSDVKNDISRNALSFGDRVVENNDDRVVIEYDDRIDGMALQKHYVEHVTGEYHWDNDYSCDIEKQKKVAEEIVEFAKNYSDSKTDYKCRSDSATYFISRTTIWNTRALIAAGYEVVLEDWMDLDKLDTMLQNGDKIFGIRVNNGGDGVDEDALYTFGGWEGEDVFDDISGAEVLYSETM